jgi:hypothetical protein
VPFFYEWKGVEYRLWSDSTKEDIMLLESRPSVTRPATKSGPWLCLLIAPFLFFLTLPSCALVRSQGDGATVKQAGTEQKAPEPGDIKSVDGVEYVYGKNRRFTGFGAEPEYVWVRKDQYSPRPFDSLNAALQSSEADRREIEELQKRLSRLEAEIKVLGAVAEKAGAEESR